MNLLYSLFFAAGVAAFAYAKFGRRIGYGNSQNVWIFVGISFIIAFIFFYTIARFLIPSH